MAAFLIAHGADANTKAQSDGEFPQTPLQIASSMGNLRMAAMLTDAGALIDTRSDKGCTALHFAVIGSHLDMIRFLDTCKPQQSAVK